MSLEAIRRDLRQAVRQLFRTPVHSGIAILVPAIGIGANTAVFSVVNPLLLKPLSGDGVPERLTAVEVAPGLFDLLGVEPRIGRRLPPTNTCWAAHARRS